MRGIRIPTPSTDGRPRGYVILPGGMYQPLPHANGDNLTPRPLPLPPRRTHRQRAHLAGQRRELLDQEPRRQMPIQTIIRLRVVVAALDANGRQIPVGDFRCGLAPHAPVARGEGQAVGLDVAEDEDLAGGGGVAEEGGRGFRDAEGGGGVWGEGGRGAAAAVDDEGGGERGGGGDAVVDAAAVRVLLDAGAVADGEGLDEQAVADFEVAAVGALAEDGGAAVDEAREGDEAGAVVLVGEVGPDAVVEDVVFEGGDGVGEAGDALGAAARGRGRVDDHAVDVVEVGVGDDEALDDGLVEVQGVLGRGGVGEGEASKGPGGEGVGEGEGGRLAEVWGLGVAEDGFDGAEVDAGVDADDGAALPVRGDGADEEGRHIVFFWTATSALIVCVSGGSSTCWWSIGEGETASAVTAHWRPRNPVSLRHAGEKREPKKKGQS